MKEITLGNLTINRQLNLWHQVHPVRVAVPLLCHAHLGAVIPDEKLEAVLKAIDVSARTGAVGDGKVFVSGIEDVLRVRTGERGAAAV